MISNKKINQLEEIISYSFKNKQLAMEVKKKLSKFRGEDPWIAYIK